jgi:hypothetical protein
MLATAPARNPVASANQAGGGVATRVRVPAVQKTRVPFA